MYRELAGLQSVKPLLPYELEVLVKLRWMVNGLVYLFSERSRVLRRQRIRGSVS